MGLRFVNQGFGICFFVTTTFRDWNRFGNTPGVYETLADSCRHYAREYNAQLIGYVFMPSHLHLLILIDGKELANFMRDFKKYVSQKAMKDIGIRDKQIWQPGYDRQVVYSEEVFRTKLEYIHNNPIRGGLVENPADWKWSSALDYLAEREGPIPVWKDWMF
jgi:putative transposase